MSKCSICKSNAVALQQSFVLDADHAKLINFLNIGTYVDVENTPMGVKVTLKDAAVYAYRARGAAHPDASLAVLRELGLVGCCCNAAVLRKLRECDMSRLKIGDGPLTDSDVAMFFAIPGCATLFFTSLPGVCSASVSKGLLLRGVVQSALSGMWGECATKEARNASGGRLSTVQKCAAVAFHEGMTNSVESLRALCVENILARKKFEAYATPENVSHACSVLLPNVDLSLFKKVCDAYLQSRVAGDDSRRDALLETLDTLFEEGCVLQAALGSCLLHDDGCHPVNVATLLMVALAHKYHTSENKETCMVQNLLLWRICSSPISIDKVDGYQPPQDPRHMRLEVHAPQSADDAATLLFRVQVKKGRKRARKAAEEAVEPAIAPEPAAAAAPEARRVRFAEEPKRVRKAAEKAAEPKAKRARNATDKAEEPKAKRARKAVEPAIAPEPAAAAVPEAEESAVAAVSEAGEPAIAPEPAAAAAPEAEESAVAAVSEAGEPAIAPEPAAAAAPEARRVRFAEEPKRVRKAAEKAAEPKAKRARNATDKAEEPKAKRARKAVEPAIAPEPAAAAVPEAEESAVAAVSEAGEPAIAPEPAAAAVSEASEPAAAAVPEAEEPQPAAVSEDEEAGSEVEEDADGSDSDELAIGDEYSQLEVNDLT